MQWPINDPETPALVFQQTPWSHCDDLQFAHSAHGESPLNLGNHLRHQRTTLGQNSLSYNDMQLSDRRLTDPEFEVGSTTGRGAVAEKMEV